MNAPRYQGMMPDQLPNRPETVDQLSPAVRHLVHEFGYSMVREFDMAGITDPKLVRRLIHAVWRGSREPGNKPSGMPLPGFIKELDAAWPRIPNGSAMVGFLHSMQVTVCSLTPSAAMVQASIAEVSRHGVISKEEKHRYRLEAALRAQSDHLMGAIRGWHRG